MSNLNQIQKVNTNDFIFMNQDNCKEILDEFLRGDSFESFVIGEAYAIFKTWCNKHEIVAPNAQVFGRYVKIAYNLGSRKMRVHGQPKSVFVKIENDSRRKNADYLKRNAES